LTVDDMHSNNNEAFHIAMQNGYHDIVHFLSTL